MASIEINNFNIGYLSRVNLKDLTNSQLREFIKASAKRIEQSFDVDNEQIRKSANIIRRKVGTRIIHGEERIIKGYSKMNREELLSRARLFQSHLAIDVFTNEAIMENHKLAESVKEKLSEMFDVDMSDEEWSLYVFFMHDARNLNMKFDSTDWASTVTSIIEEAREYGSGDVDIIYTVHQVWEQSKGLGWDLEDMQKEIMDRLRYEL